MLNCIFYKTEIFKKTKQNRRLDSIQKATALSLQNQNKAVNDRCLEVFNSYCYHESEATWQNVKHMLFCMRGKFQEKVEIFTLYWSASIIQCVRITYGPNNQRAEL